MLLTTILILLLALYTISTINPVYAVISLISIFIFTSLFLIFLSINFLAISFIIIYVGAIAILFLFIVMMINIKYLHTSHTNTNLPLAAIIISLYALELSPLLNMSYGMEIYTSGEVNWNSILFSLNQLEAIGNNFYSNYSLWLILISILLLLAMMGPIILIHDINNTNSVSKKNGTSKII